MDLGTLGGPNSRAYAINSQEIMLERLEHALEAGRLDPRFSSAHVLVADFWSNQLRPHALFAGITDTSPTERMANFSVAIDQAIATAPTEIMRKGQEALKANLELRFHDAIQLYLDYLAERPNDFLAWANLINVSKMANDRASLDQALAYFRKAGFKTPEHAGQYLSASFSVYDIGEVTAYGRDRLKRFPNHLGITYQQHRALLWAGEVEEAAGLAERFNKARPGNALLLIRQACAEGDREKATQALQFLNERAYRGISYWLILNLLGEKQQAEDQYRELTADFSLFEKSAWLYYAYFDPSPFPELMELLERQGVTHPPPIEIPFQCPPN